MTWIITSELNQSEPCHNMQPERYVNEYLHAIIIFYDKCLKRNLCRTRQARRILLDGIRNTNNKSTNSASRISVSRWVSSYVCTHLEKSEWQSTRCRFRILRLHFINVVSTKGGFFTTILVKESTTKPLWYLG